MLRTGFDRLRANGGGLENIENCPFVLSLSKHEHHFFSTLLNRPSQHWHPSVEAILVIALGEGQQQQGEYKIRPYGSLFPSPFTLPLSPFTLHPSLSPVTCHLSPIPCHLVASWRTRS
jgi:hypothetical protein